MKFIAHRGCSGREVENTRAAFRAAIIHNADGIETDLRRARDGSLWLFHDDDFKRLAQRNESIESSDAPALCEVRLAGGGRLATLEELLNLIRTTAPPGFRLNLELKGSQPSQRALAVELAARDRASEFHGLTLVVSSFDHAALRALRKLDATIPLAPLWSGRGLFSPVLRTARALGAEAIHLAARAVSARRVAALRRAGLRTRVYTVNDPVVAKKLSAIGVDAIFTDDPVVVRNGIA